MKLIGSLLPLFFVTALSAQVPELSSSAVSEAVEQLVGRRAHMTNEIHLLAGARMAGPAITMRLVRDEKASSMAAGLTAIKLLEGAPEGSVVVAALNDDKAFAVFGSTFAALAKTRKLAGFVVDGSVRDLSDFEAPCLFHLRSGYGGRFGWGTLSDRQHECSASVRRN